MGVPRRDKRLSGLQRGRSQIRDAQNSQTRSAYAQTLKQAVGELLPASADVFEYGKADVEEKVADHLDDSASQSPLPSSLRVHEQRDSHEGDEDQHQIPGLQSGKQVQKAPACQLN